MSRYGVLTGKKKKILPTKKEFPRKYKKIIVGMKGSGKTGALIEEIKFALSVPISPIPVYLQYINNKNRFQRDLSSSSRKLIFRHVDMMSLNEMGSYKIAFFDDLSLKPEIVDYILTYAHSSSYMEGIIITCSLIEFMNYVGQHTEVWRYLQTCEWKVEQLNGSI